jgi:RNA polymerase sigma factor (sigma-70 family)
MHDDPDRELFDAWRCGDKKAGDQLFTRHFDELYGFLRSKVGDAVEDLLQQTWMQLVQNRDKFTGEGSFRAYIFGVARHVLLDHLRRKYRRYNKHIDLTELLEQSLEDLGVSPLAAMAERQEVVLVAHALRRIPLDAQILFELHYWQKLPAPQLAVMLDIPEGTVRSRLRRAKELVFEKARELASSPEELASTLSGFDTWAERVRASAAWRRPTAG